MKRSRVQDLPEVIVTSLGLFQDGLNNLIDSKWQEVRKLDEWGLAITMESAELIDSYPWKWWKNINASPDLQNAKVEIVDILHFALSGSIQSKNFPPQDVDNNVSFKSPEEKYSSEYKSFVFLPLDKTPNAVATMGNIIQLARGYRFDTIIEGLFVCAADLGFDLVAFYVAKHTLNYIRQLNGYKSGSYVKVQKGVEDNVLLHDCIKNISSEDSIDPEKYVSIWNTVISNVYDAFNVSQTDRKTADYWLKK